MGQKKDSPESYERWLVHVASHLRKQDLDATLLYDDRFRGDALAVVLHLPGGLVELLIHKRGRGASVIALAGSAQVARTAAGFCQGLARKAHLWQRAKVTFLQLVEALLSHVAATWGQRSGGYPTATLEALRTLTPEAGPMVGCEVVHHEKEHEAVEVATVSGLSKAEHKRYVSRFAAAVPVSSGPASMRAILYSGQSATFEPRGDAQASLQERVARDGRPAAAFGLGLAAAVGAVAGAEMIVGAGHTESSYVLDVAEGMAESACDVADCLSSSGGMCNLDCDFVPSCDFVPDCDCMPDCAV